MQWATDLVCFPVITQLSYNQFISLKFSQLAKAHKTRSHNFSHLASPNSSETLCELSAVRMATNRSNKILGAMRLNYLRIDLCTGRTQNIVTQEKLCERIMREPD